MLWMGESVMILKNGRKWCLPSATTLVLWSTGMLSTSGAIPAVNRLEKRFATEESMAPVILVNLFHEHRNQNPLFRA